MKWFNVLLVSMSLFFAACGGTDKPSDALTEEEKAEVQKLDSMANELEAVKGELRENTEALNSALEALEE